MGKLYLLHGEYKIENAIAFKIKRLFYIFTRLNLKNSENYYFMVDSLTLYIFLFKIQLSPH